MKNKRLKNYLKIGSLLFGIFIVILACEKETIDNIQEQVQEKRLQMISLDQLNNRIGNSKNFENLSKAFDVNRLEQNDNPWLMTDEIAMIEKNGATYYTFRISKTTESDDFYNLVVVFDDMGNLLSSTILEYTPNENWLQDTSQPFVGEVSSHENYIFALDDINNLFSSRAAKQCITGISYIWNCGANNNHPPGHSDCDPDNNAVTEIIGISVQYGACPPEFTTGDDDDYPVDTSPPSGGGGGGSGGTASSNDDCVPAIDNPCDEEETAILIPPDEEEENDDTPCPGDPVPNPEIAPQYGSSGTKGALHGCTRYGGGCSSSDGRNKKHNGIDIKNDYGKPLYALFDGEVLVNYRQKGKAGYVTRIRSELPSGEIIIYQYFHMQNDGRLAAGTQITAGDVVGYQGDSGNLKKAIEDGTVDSHVHIKMNLYDGTGDSYDYSNNFKNNPVNPADYMHTEIDEEGNSNTPNCN